MATGKPYDHLCKVLLVGDSSTSKSGILLNFCSADVPFTSTIGVDFKIQHLQVDGKNVKLQIWDTAGQERFHTITTSYYRGSSGIFLVYDITNIRSFENLIAWLTNIKQHAHENVQIMVLGNKCDLAESRQVSTERGRMFAEEHGLKFMEISGQTGENVKKALLTLTEDIISSLGQHN